jgi:hypothetical protein
VALETGTYVSDLVATNPTAGDPVSQADDHLRLLKSTLQNTFPDADAPIYGLRAKTAQASTSGTSIDFTSIPSWVKRVTVMFSGVSTNGTSLPIVQIGDSGGVETSSYSGTSNVIQNGSATQAIAHSTGFSMSGASSISAASTFFGTVVLTQITGNTWVASINLGTGNVAATITGGGSKALSAALDRVRITTVGGSDTFDAGTINALYE